MYQERRLQQHCEDDAIDRSPQMRIMVHPVTTPFIHVVTEDQVRDTENHTGKAQDSVQAKPFQRIEQDEREHDRRYRSGGPKPL